MRPRIASWRSPRFQDREPDGPLRSTIESRMARKARVATTLESFPCSYRQAYLGGQRMTTTQAKVARRSLRRKDLKVCQLAHLDLRPPRFETAIALSNAQAAEM